MDMRGRAPELVDFASQHALQGCAYGVESLGLCSYGTSQMEALH
jgi:hypothetical protein